MPSSNTYRRAGFTRMRMQIQRSAVQRSNREKYCFELHCFPSHCFDNLFTPDRLIDYNRGHFFHIYSKNRSQLNDDRRTHMKCL